MKITPHIPQIPFTERIFNVELTGLELAVIHLLTANCNGGSSTVGDITSKMYYTLEKYVSYDRYFNSKLDTIQTINIPLSEFKEKTDEINK